MHTDPDFPIFHVASISPRARKIYLKHNENLFKGHFRALSQGIWKSQHKPTIIDGKSLQGWGGLSLSMESAVSEVPKTDSLEYDSNSEL